MAQPRARKRSGGSPTRGSNAGGATNASANGSRPAAPKELRPWQLVAFIVVGLAVAGTFVGVGFAKKSHDEYGQWPWAKTAVPPQMYYAHTHYKAAGAGTTAGLVQVGKTPGGGLIFAPTTTKKPAPTTIEVKKDAAATQVTAYTLTPST